MKLLLLNASASSFEENVYSCLLFLVCNMRKCKTKVLCACFTVHTNQNNIHVFAIEILN